jgi:Ca2+-binding EF-hand superfamily protein
MSKTIKIAIAAGVLVAIGAAAAVSQHAGGGHHGRWMGGMHHGDDLGGGFRHHRMGMSVTKDEYDARTRERFARLDRNSDGAIDAAEVEASFSERMQHGMMGGKGPRMGERMMRMFDENRDGKVTRDEFLAGIRKRFAELDLDNDGRITDADLPPMMRGRNLIAEGGPQHGMMGRRAGPFSIVFGADANKDGAVTLDEALAVATARFAQVDRNKDGTADQADRDALRKEMIDWRVKRFIHVHGGDAAGRVTREQFTAKAAERFARMDLNNDGVLSRDEMPGRGRGMGMMHGRHGHGGDDVGPGRGHRGEGPGMGGHHMMPQMPGPGAPGRGPAN